MFLTFYIIGALICFLISIIGLTLFIFTKKHGILDFFWGMSIMIAGISLTYHTFSSHPYLSSIMYSMLILWGTRLSLFFFKRLLSPHDDRRYKKITQSTIFGMLKQCLIQSALQPLLILTFYPLTKPLLNITMPWLFIGGIIFFLGFIGEWISDAQLSQFKKTTTGICSIGLWKYSRHPNYFFESIIWLGLSVPFVCSGFLISLLGPISIFIITYYITGPISERCSVERHGLAYKNYQQTTSYFFPLHKKSHAD